MDYKIACIRCGYRLPVLWSSALEMIEILEAAGWRVDSVKKGRGLCPRCRRED